MILTPKLLPGHFPGRCALFTQRVSDPEGFVLGEELEPPPGRFVQQAVSVTGIREAARQFAQMVDESELAAEKELNAELESRIAQLEQELMDQDIVMQGYDGMAKAGFMLKRVPGRPKKVET